MEEKSATDLTEVAADSVNLWSATFKSWVNVRDILVEKAQSTSPFTVTIPVADEVETFLAYPNATSGQVPDLEGILAYIAQQQRLGAGSVTNRYVKNFFTKEGDTHVAQQLVTLQVVMRPVFMDVFAPTFVNKKSSNRRSSAPRSSLLKTRDLYKNWKRSPDPLQRESS